MHRLGRLTIPHQLHGVSLSEFWAWIRYFAAPSSSADLRLSRHFRDLDPHQKTILSDDWGVAFGMDFLARTLGLIQIIDGRDFVRRRIAHLGGSYVGHGKIGNQKCPDFVALDNQNRWHIIECKGTQSSLSTRKGQLHTALSQKSVIQLPNNIMGERLATGLFIGTEGKGPTSSLKIVDPDAPERLIFTEEEVRFAERDCLRGTMAKAFAFSGFPALASLYSFRLSARQSGAEWFENGARRVDVYQAVKHELENAMDRKRFDGLDEEFIGFQFELDFNTFPQLKPVSFEKDMSSRLTVRSGVKAEFFENVLVQLKGTRRTEEIIGEAFEYNSLRDMEQTMTLEGGKSVLTEGGHFYSEVKFD